MKISHSQDEASKQLSTLLDMNPEAASQSEGYANRVEKLAMKTDDLQESEDTEYQILEPIYAHLSKHGKPDFSSESETKLEETYNEGQDDTIPETSDYLESLDETPNYLESIDKIYEEETSEKYVEPISSLVSLRTDEQSYAERNLGRELRKGPADADLGRVQTLAERVYTQNFN